MHTTFFLIGFFAFLLVMIVFGSVMSRRYRGDGDNFLLGQRARFSDHRHHGGDHGGYRLQHGRGGLWL